jgi:hypothetical protein
MHMISNRFVAHVAGLFCYPFLAFAASLLYRPFLEWVVGAPTGGYGVTSVMVVFPMYAIPLFAFWLVAWELVRAALKRPLALPVTLVLATLVGLMFGWLVSGPAGFASTGSRIYYSYFLLGFHLVGVSIHYILLPRTQAAG